MFVHAAPLLRNSGDVTKWCLLERESSQSARM